ncbi:MAG: MraY family glycosyltransferase, partial [Quisquiliibacterium sp.]
FVGAALFTLMGYLDDRQERPVVVRLVAQALILFLVLKHDLFLLDLGKIFGSTDFSLGFAAIPVTLFVFVGVINAVNMTDGIDGLAAVIGITALVGFLAATAQPLILDPASIMHIAHTQQLAGAAIGALIGFLFYNLRTPWRLQASVFLGDAGSMLLGFILGWMAIVTISPGPPTGIDIPPVICLWILIIPLFDAVSCILRRVLERRNPFLADKRHLHHLLLKQGMNQTQVVFALGGTNALGAAIGVISWRLQIPEPLLFWTYLALFGLFTGYVIRFWRREAADLGANTATQSPGGKR